MPIKYDAIVIGTGQAGPSLAARLAKAGRNTAMIERKRYGGTCVNVGCIPTKTLVASARAIHMARRGDEFGFTAGGPVKVDMARVKARMYGVAGQSSDGVEQWMKKTPGLTVYEGHGRFTGPHRVAVGDHELEADELFVNVGARAVVPDMPGSGDVPLLTNSSLLGLDILPEHLVIVGGSYIGLEFAQVYRRFGSRVTVVERGARIIAREDEDVSTTLQGVLESEGIEFRLSANCIALSRTATGIAASVDCSSGAPAIEGTHVLLAVGRPCDRRPRPRAPTPGRPTT
jgi:pyruvate/2-oxoglutarate dehydrogenase complex dihydrolipoamide dehydrogenase (E3) component